MKLPKTYQSIDFEEIIYALWEKNNVFVADPKSHKQHFSIMMPPPNETGTLGVHHALFLTLQDIIARHARAKNLDVLWLPGTDHAALAVNAIMEKKLTSEGLTKHQIGRDEFLARTMNFVADSRGTMLTQMRAVGASADWTRLRYTLDDTLNRTVNETFVAMYQKGLIYRGKRIVNWDPVFETTVSDEEVDYVSETTSLYTFKFGPFEITTTRPETKFGDKYVVMHPDDKRYSKYKHGDSFKTEWINGPITATIIKDSAIDPSFGTGVMTITPWHSLVDFEIAERHQLDSEQIIDFHGKLVEACGEFGGLSIDQARPLIVDKLKKKKLLIKIDDSYVHNTAVNSRGGAVIEPQIRLQWFIDVNKEVVDWKGKKLSLKKVLKQAIEDEEIEIIPKRFEKTYYSWIDNLRDWCISRQIWWGHRIPVWYRHDTDQKEEVYCGLIPPQDQSEGNNEWQQDPDTLDTWFSSSLWTFSTLIDPELTSDNKMSFKDLLAKSLDFQTYHPTNVLETGWDIIFFWVARMILSTTFMTGQVPFKQVYLHGLVRSADGKKMSKSRPETVVDPIKIINEFGADSLRLSLIMGVSPGNDQNFSLEKVTASRNFCNKLWNIARFVENIASDSVDQQKVEPLSDADHWILHQIEKAQKQIIQLLDRYQFSEAYDVVYRLIWNDYADWYIEFSKDSPSIPMLVYSLKTILKLVHPFAPFVSEAIWQTLFLDDDSILAQQQYQKVLNTKINQANNFDQIKNIVIEAREIVKKTRATDLTLYHNNEEAISVNKVIIKKMVNLKDVVAVEDGNGLYLTSTKYRAWLDIDQSTAKLYLSELADKITDQEKAIAALELRLSNSDYIKKAPKDLIKQSREQQDIAREKLANLRTEYKRFSN